MPRPDKQEPVVFDLVEDGSGAVPDDGDDGADGVPDRRPTLRSRLSGLPHLSRRTWVVTAAVVIALVVTTGAADLVRDHRRTELMRGSSVGVVSLAEPPAETWTVPFDTPARESEDTWVDQQLVTMDGLLVLPPGSAQDYTIDASTGAAEPRQVGFEGVVAVDPGSGDVAWRVEVGEHPVCGPTSYDASISTDVLVCVHGPEDAREVLTITPDGESRSRPADLADGEQIFPGPDGLAVRVVRIGDAGPDAECDLTGVCTPLVLEEGRDARVTAEDAGTGAQRWRSTIEFTSVDPSNCQQNDVGGGALLVDPDHVSVRAEAWSVAVDGCGTRGTLSVQGTRLDTATDDKGSFAGWTRVLGPGLYALEGPALKTTILNDAGETLRTVDGWLQGEATSPDAPDDLLFVSTTSGSGFDAVREDGSVAWTERQGQQNLLAGRDVVVVDRGTSVVGLDRDTGAELWTWDSSTAAPGLARYRALTDGETVALEHTSPDGSADGLLVALDLDTGERLWDVPMTGTAVAVDGHVVELTSNGLRGLG